MGQYIKIYGTGAKWRVTGDHASPSQATFGWGPVVCSDDTYIETCATGTKWFFHYLPPIFTARRSICCRHVSTVCPSVRHKPVSYQNDWTNRADFWYVGFLTTPIRQSTSRGCSLLVGQPSYSITLICGGFVVRLYSSWQDFYRHCASQ